MKKEVLLDEGSVRYAINDVFTSMSENKPVCAYALMIVMRAASIYVERYLSRERVTLEEIKNPR